MFKKLLLVLIVSASLHLSAKNVEFANIYLNQAGPELVGLVDEVVQEIGYAGNYELVEPNKMGLQMNPWNGMIGACVNPQTQNNQLVINPVWFNNLPKDEQKFLIARYLIKFEQTGGWLTVVKVLPILLLILLFIVLFLFWMLVINKTGLRDKARWQKMLVMYLVAVGFHLMIMPKIQKALSDVLCYKYEVNLDRLVLEKLPNKLAAIGALKAMDKAIKAGIADGHNLFKSSENTFSNLAQELEK